MWAPKEGGGLTLRAANAHSSTERRRFYILRLHGQAKSMAGTGTAAGRAVERGGEPVPRRSGRLVDPVFGERRCRAARREGPEGQGGPGRARGSAKAGGAPQSGVQRRKAVLGRRKRLLRHSALLSATRRCGSRDRRPSLRDASRPRRTSEASPASRPW